MAEAFLEIVMENLSSLIQGEIGLIMGVDEEMKKLSSILTTIQAVLEDAEEKQLKSKPIHNWLCKLKEVAYEIDDILDECATHASKLKHRSRTSSGSSLKRILSRHKIGRRMKQVTAKLDAVAAERAKYHLREMAVERQREVAATRETCSVLNEPDHVYGREEEKDKIVDILVNHVRENQEISVLPIVGVGGLGKTTLAQLVFNDQRVVEHFETRLWVCVSDNFDLKTLIKAMIESTPGSGSASDLHSLDALQQRLTQLLSEKKYLLVLDDVWNEDQVKWSELRSILPFGSSGTSIIITTRLRKVADIMGTFSAHYLAGLSEEHCWMLLRRHAFGEQKGEHPELEAIGKQIVKKCAGVPLAAKALGGLLRFKRTEREWIYVKESEIWDLSQEEALILPALRLSYHHLPLALRQCFAYCAVFPKDTSIEKQELIFRWISHGYISSKGILEVEEVGDGICNELVLRSLLQDTSSKDSMTFTMHDLVHDLAHSIIDNKVPGREFETKIAVNTSIREANLSDGYVCFPISNQHDMNMSSILMKYRRLRVLEVIWQETKDFASKVGDLKHLRYLNLSFSDFQTLPNSLCSLWNLQILNLTYCQKLEALPKKMRYLINLRHLCLEECTSLSEMPPKIRELTCLKTLSLFIVDGCNQLEELQCLNLGGMLEIKHLERVKNHIDAKANLAEKNNLRHLRLTWERDGPSRLRKDLDEKVLEALEPHPNLETLEIRGFCGRNIPVWMSKSSMEKLVRITIKDCPYCLRLPQLGRLPHLKYMRLEKMAVEYIIEDEVEGGNDPVNIQLFPSLEKLELYELPNLKGLLQEQVTRAAFPNLLKLKIKNCCSSVVLPELPSLQELKVKYCSSISLALFAKLPTLISLSATIDEESTKCFPLETLENLGNLESLTISRAQEISVPEEGLRGLKSLEFLKIERSGMLRCLPKGLLQHLTALKTLLIVGCPEFVELPEEIKYLQCIERVQLVDLPKMVCLPKALQHLSSSLKILDLDSLPQLNSLPDWLDHLTSLRTLYIWYCPQLGSLPASIRGMPNLQYLHVQGCPELVRRCERGTGEDWHKIAHIPRLYILP